MQTSAVEVMMDGVHLKENDEKSEKNYLVAIFNQISNGKYMLLRF